MSGPARFIPPYEVTPEYVDLCRDEMNALAEASQTLVLEIATIKPRMTQEQIDVRRAELYLEHLNRAGLAIVRFDKEDHS